MEKVLKKEKKVMVWTFRSFKNIKKKVEQRSSVLKSYGKNQLLLSEYSTSTLSSPYVSTACSSDKPTVPNSRGVNTVVGIL